MQVGTIDGTVHLAALAAAQLAAGSPVTDCHAGLYLFPGATATRDDFDRDLSTDDDGAVDPIYLQPVANDGVVTDVSYSIPFVEAGQSYTLAATCDFDKDGMDTNYYRPNAAQGEDGYQTMRWTAVNNVAVHCGDDDDLGTLRPKDRLIQGSPLYGSNAALDELANATSMRHRETIAVTFRARGNICAAPNRRIFLTAENCLRPVSRRT